MKELILNDKAYEAFLKPYYENKTRLNASFGSLFSANKDGFSDNELKKVCFYFSKRLFGSDVNREVSILQDKKHFFTST